MFFMHSFKKYALNTQICNTQLSKFLYKAHSFQTLIFVFLDHCRTLCFTKQNNDAKIIAVHVSTFIPF